MARPPRIDLPEALYHVTGRRMTRRFWRRWRPAGTWWAVRDLWKKRSGDWLRGPAVVRKTRRVDLPRAVVEIGCMDRVVAGHYGISTEPLRQRGSCVGAPKFVAVELACRFTDMTQRPIGTCYGGIASAAVSNIRRRLRKSQDAWIDVVEGSLRVLAPVGS